MPSCVSPIQGVLGFVTNDHNAAWCLNGKAGFIPITEFKAVVVNFLYFIFLGVKLGDFKLYSLVTQLVCMVMTETLRLFILG